MKLDKAIEVLEAYSQTRMNTELPIVEAIDTILEAVKPKVETKDVKNNWKSIISIIETYRGFGKPTNEIIDVLMQTDHELVKKINPTKP